MLEFEEGCPRNVGEDGKLIGEITGYGGASAQALRLTQQMRPTTFRLKCHWITDSFSSPGSHDNIQRKKCNIQKTKRVRRASAVKSDINLQK